MVSICLSIYFYRKNKKKKELSFQEISKTPLITQVHKSVSIHIDDIEVKQNLNLVILKISNSGNEPIKKEDFETDISINFTRHYRNSRIYDSELYKKNPKDLRCDIYIDESSEELGIKPLLLNPKDELTIKLLVTDYDEIEFSSRIIGGNINRINKKTNAWKNIFEGNNFVTILFLIAFILNFIYQIVRTIYK